VVNRGFSTEEFTVWVTQNNFYVNQDLERLEYWTSRIPIELRVVLNIKNTLSSTATLDEVLEQYRASRAEIFRAQQELFEKDHLTTPDLRKRAMRAVTLMLLGVDVSEHDYKMNKLLMFEESRVIYPTTPIVRKMLESYWKMDQEADFGVNL
jgi:hypothetical protein